MPCRRPCGNWSVKLELPVEVDAAKIAAQFENGVLIVRVPKAVKAAALRIPIGAVDTVIEGSADPINSDRYLVRDVQVQ